MVLRCHASKTMSDHSFAHRLKVRSRMNRRTAAGRINPASTVVQESSCANASAASSF